MPAARPASATGNAAEAGREAVRTARDNLLTALRDVRADAVMHQLTALNTRKMREALEGTNYLRTTGTTHLLAAALVPWT